MKRTTVIVQMGEVPLAVNLVLGLGTAVCIVLTALAAALTFRLL